MTTPAAAVTEKNHIGIPAKAIVVLALVVAAGSFGSSLVRLTTDSGMSPVAIIALRLPLGWLIFTPLVLREHYADLRQMTRQEVGFTAAAGAWMTLQLVLMMAAIERTSILISQVMLNTLPLWVAALETVFLKLRLQRLVILGLFLLLAGSVIIGVGSANRDQSEERDSAPVGDVESLDDTQSGNPLLGAALGLCSAVVGAIYLTIGRKVRQSVAFVPYVWVLFGSSAVVGVVVAALTGTPFFDYSGEAFLWLLLLLVVAQLIVHPGMSYLVGYISATSVSVSTQAMTVNAAIVAFFLFAEVPEPLEIIGSIVVVIGVMIAIWGQQKKNNS